MSAFEQLVRPFQLEDVTPPKRLMEAEKDVEDVIVTFGKAGSGKTFIYEIFLFTNFSSEDDRTHIEVSRKEDTKHVTNPSDSEQFVDLKVMRELKVRKKTDPTDYTVTKFNNPD